MDQWKENGIDRLNRYRYCEYVGSIMMLSLIQQVYLTKNFKYNLQGTKVIVKKGTQATVLVGPVTKRV